MTTPTNIREREEKCKCCGGDIKIRNPKGYCDHLYYPENCNGKCNQKVEEWEEKAVGKNVHSVYVFCYECKTDGINFPLERKCGNCGSMDTMTYYDRETITNLLAEQRRQFAKKINDNSIGGIVKEKDILKDI
jgi:hypothetical protein